MKPAVVASKNGPTRRDYLCLAALASVISLAALLFYFHRGAILLYGDAVAHINIARRVFDSRTPGLFQLGTVWLPLQHILDIPFIFNDWLWRTGLGASVPSMAAYVAGTLGIFRLLLARASRAAAWIGALIYALNPNMLYMQTTAMTEVLYLALLIWTVVYFSEFVSQISSGASDEMARARKSLDKCALLTAAAMLVRYDAWFLAAAMTLAIALALWRFKAWASVARAGFVHFVLLTSLTAGLWLAYNHGAYGNALEFANGPYSARAIMQRSFTPTMRTYPGENNPQHAALYFLKISRLNLAAGHLDYFLFAVAFVALVSLFYFSRQSLPLVLLWAPLPFYVLCIAWNSVPIYFPDWWPHSYYNVRYGLQMLPAVAAFVALAYEFGRKFFPARYVAAAFVLLVGLSYISVWRETPLCLREAIVNGEPRMLFDEKLAAELKKLPPAAIVMMDCGAHSGAVQLAGIPFRRFLRESNPPYWQIGLSGPAKVADYVVAIEGDDVSRAVRLFPQGLQLRATLDTPGQPRVSIYRSAR
jgi:hypothetical protein